MQRVLRNFFDLQAPTTGASSQQRQLSSVSFHRSSRRSNERSEAGGPFLWSSWTSRGPAASLPQCSGRWAVLLSTTAPTNRAQCFWEAAASTDTRAIPS